MASTCTDVRSLERAEGVLAIPGKRHLGVVRPEVPGSTGVGAQEWSGQSAVISLLRASARDPSQSLGHSAPQLWGMCEFSRRVLLACERLGALPCLMDTSVSDTATQKPTAPWHV